MSATAPPGVNKNANKLLPFALGTSRYPVPISGTGGPLTWGTGNNTGGGVSVLTPIPKTGFLAKLRYNFSGTITLSQAASSSYTVPIWRTVKNYQLLNSLNYPYRSLNADDIWFWMQTSSTQGLADPIVNSKNWKAIDPTSTNPQTFNWYFEDLIGHNDNVNFSRYLLSAMTTSNDLTIQISWASTAAGAIAPVITMTTVPNVSAFTQSCQVSAEYLTVPAPTKYQWPRRNLVQQIVGDPSFNTPAQGLNVVNLTPIQGPEFTGLGIQVVNASGIVDTLAPATTGITEIDIYVNGTIPLYQFRFADLIAIYERMFGRSPSFGYLYLDFSNDLGIVNAMSHTHRKVLSTAKYSQISVQVTLGANFTAGAGAYINLWKRTQQKYANNQ